MEATFIFEDDSRSEGMFLHQKEEFFMHTEQELCTVLVERNMRANLKEVRKTEKG
jgi:hypothetical protein